MSMHNRNAAKKTGLWCYSMFGVFLKNSSS